jgi:NitT/TauT family transport system permease protein
MHMPRYRALRRYRVFVAAGGVALWQPLPAFCNSAPVRRVYASLPGLLFDCVCMMAKMMITKQDFTAKTAGNGTTVPPVVDGGSEWNPETNGAVAPLPESSVRAGYVRTGTAGSGAFVQRHRDLLLAPFVIGATILLWEGLVRWQEYPAFVLPAPALVARRFVQAAADGMLWRHVQATVTEIVLGLLLGVTSALLLGYVLGKNRTIDRLIAPYIVASQSVPIVALAPLLVIWFGAGLLSKVLVVALIAFFPTLISTIVGLRGVDGDLRDLMRSLKASRVQTFRMLELPASLPVLFGGLKLSVILAVVGAVVGELMGASSGLGYLINLARGVLDTPLLFVAIISLVILAQLLYWGVALLERRALRWQ